MSDQRRTLVRVRAGHKAYVSSLLSNIETIKKEPEHYIEMLRATKEKMGDLTGQILAILNTDQEVSDEIMRENDYTKRINELIKELQSGITSSTTTVVSEDGQVRLPPISIKRFYGNLEDWLPFWESY